MVHGFYLLFLVFLGLFDGSLWFLGVLVNLFGGFW